MKVDRWLRWCAAVAATCFVVFLALARPGTIRGQTASGVPALDHVFIVMLENHSFSSIVGNTTSAPYINKTLLPMGALATNFHAVTHDSLPNYLGFTDGMNYSANTKMDSNCLPSSCPVADPNVVDSLHAAGKSWKAYLESMPSSCYRSNSGLYVARHNPFVYYTDTAAAGDCSTNDAPYTQLASDLASTGSTPAFSLIVPNLCDDMHGSLNCPSTSNYIAQGDTWLSNNLPAIFSSPAWTTQRSLLVLSWDEGAGASKTLGEDCINSTTDESCHVATLLIGSTGAGTIVRAGCRETATFGSSADDYNGFSLLRTIEDGLGLPRVSPTSLDNAASDMTDLFVTGPQFVQEAGATETVTSTSLTANLSSHAGDLLVLGASVQAGMTNSVTNVTDSAGNTWLEAGEWAVSGHNSDGELWYCPNARAVTSVTATTAAGTLLAFDVAEFSGVSSTPLDATTGSANLGTAPTSGSATTITAPELAVGMITDHSSSQPITLTAVGYSSLPQFTSTAGTTSTAVRLGYKVLPATSTETFTGTLGTARYWSDGLATFVGS